MRHTAATVALARDLHATGMTPTQVQHTLARVGTRVARSTIAYWVDTDFRAARQTRPGRSRRTRMQRRDKLIRELREDGLSFTAIAVVLRRYHGWNITESTVRHRATIMGLPKSPAKIELGRRYLRQETTG